MPGHATLDSYAHVYVHDHRVSCAAGNDHHGWHSVAAGTQHLIKQGKHWLAPESRSLFDLLHETSTRLLLPAYAHLSTPALAVSTSKGRTDAWLNDADDLRALTAHPHWWPGSANSSIAAQQGITLFHDIGAVAACSTGLSAILAAANMIETGRTDWAIAGAADQSQQDLLFAGFGQLGVLATNQPTALQGHGTGFGIGSGAGLLVLSSTPNPHGWRVCGGRQLGDASHETACGDAAVFHACLESLWQCCPEPDAIITHGTGTAAGDAYELAGYEAGPWRSSERITYKPHIGHCLGASGAVELALACHGPWQRIWKISLGFGGHVAGVALERKN